MHTRRQRPLLVHVLLFEVQQSKSETVGERFASKSSRRKAKMQKNDFFGPISTEQLRADYIVFEHGPCLFPVFQDRLTFRRIIVKNNAKKRKLYEAFIETLPLLTSLEVSFS